MPPPPNIDATALLGLGFSAIGLFLSLFFLLRRKLRDDGYFWGYLIIFFIALELGFKTMVHSRLFLQFPFFFAPGRFYNLLLYPTFLIFLLSITQKRTLPHKWKWMLMAPLLGYALYQFGRLFFIPSDVKLAMLDSFYRDSRPGPFNYWSNMGTLLKTVIVPLLFLVPIAYYFLRFLRNSENRPDRTLTVLLGTSILVYFLFTLTSNSIYQWLFGATQISMIEWPVDIVFLSFMAMLFCMVVLLVNTGSSLFPPIKYATSALDPKDYSQILSRAEALMQSEQLYLQKSINIGALAKRLDTNSKYISQAINHELGKSFTDFLNGYRVEEAKQQLLDPKNNNLTLEAVGALAGFGSKSAFFGAFKKHTGQTPAQFLEENKK